VLNSRFLKTQIIGKTFISELHCLPEVDSTNEFAKFLAPGSGSLVVADYQTMGKGRLGRSWESKRGENLTFTIRRQFRVGRRGLQAVNFFFSYFLLSAVEAFLAETCNRHVAEFELKWPNDLLAHKKKIGGVLVERRGHRDFIIGIGLNVNQDSFKREYSRKTTSLRNITGKVIFREALLVRIIKEFDANLKLLEKQRFNEIHALWLSRCRMVGRDVDLVSGNTVINRATVAGIMQDGAILLRVGVQEKRFYSGEISLRY